MRSIRVRNYIRSNGVAVRGYSRSVAERKRLAEAKAADEEKRKRDAGTSVAVRRFQGGDDSKAWADSTFKEWEDALSPDEAEALLNYQGSEYRGLNGYLRGIEVEEDYVLDAEYAETTIDLIDSTIDRGIMPESVVVHRGFGIAESEIGKYTRGQVMFNKGYTSSSLNPAIGAKFARWATESDLRPVLMELTLPKGAKAASLENILSMKENEILLERGGNYRIISVNEDADKTIRIKADWLGRTSANR